MLLGSLPRHIVEAPPHHVGSEGVGRALEARVVDVQRVAAGRAVVPTTSTKWWPCITLAITGSPRSSFSAHIMAMRHARGINGTVTWLKDAGGATPRLFTEGRGSAENGFGSLPSAEEK